MKTAVKGSSVVRYLVVQTKQIGDVLVSTALCDNLKKNDPTSEVHYLVMDYCAGMAQGDPYIDKLIVIDKSQRNNWRYLWCLMMQLRQQHYDVVINSQGQMIGLLTCLFSGAKTRIGFDSFPWRLGHNRVVRFGLDTEHQGNCSMLDDRFSLLKPLKLAKEDFAKEIAPARTFVFVRDIVPLLEANLIKGGDLDNAIVIYEREVSQEKLDQLANVLKVPHMDATKVGYIQHKPLMWENECTRHKLLDIIGDMALIGKPIKGRIIATRPGHTINNKFARLMRKEIRKHEVQAPIYNPNEDPIMDNIRIRELLPHRYPMQLVDKITSIGSTSIVGVKNVTANEPFFTGHFPNEPVMPGVLMIEAMAQCGGLLVLSQLENPESYSTYFLKIDDVKFRQKVVPGDTLLFRVELLNPVRHGISSMKGYMFVGDQVVSEATFTAQIAKNK
jgi:UDP-3-O-[3-hydroxymyristoyl] N-acetylglucosamine deacetylase/3-hydroxyacyl-[acyl-carrier-protein] dehydratase